MTFEDFYLNDAVLNALKAHQYTQPTPIQEQVIPVIQKGVDVLASAQTGTGKTAAFSLPIINDLIPTPKLSAGEVRVLILVPTRELAIQVHQQVKKYSENTRIRSMCIYGGVSINPQMKQLGGGAHIMIATPGRLLDLHQRNAVKLNNVERLVLDEADRMLDMGFAKDLQRIIDQLPKQRHTMLFSATFSPDIRALAREFLHNAKEVNTAPKNSSASTVEHWICPVDKKLKAELLLDLIETKQWSRLIIFCKTKRGADKLHRQLSNRGLRSGVIHGDRSQAQRTTTLTQFKNEKIDYLVATDVAARGIDIDQLPHVVNFDLPKVAEDYIHRIGRTGRKGNKGEAISLVAADEIDLLVAIEQILKKHLKRIIVDGFEPIHDLPPSKPIRTEARAKKPHKGKMRRQTTDTPKRTAGSKNNKATAKSTRGKPSGNSASKPKPRSKSSGNSSAPSGARAPRRRSSR